MSVVRFYTPRSFFGSNRRPRPPAAIWGMLRVLWPCFFNFLLIRSLNRRKASRVDRERGLSYPRVLPLLCRPGFFDLRSNRPCAGPREKKALFFISGLSTGELHCPYCIAPIALRSLHCHCKKIATKGRLQAAYRTVGTVRQVPTVR